MPTTRNTILELRNPLGVPTEHNSRFKTDLPNCLLNHAFSLMPESWSNRTIASKLRSVRAPAAKYKVPHKKLLRFSLICAGTLQCNLYDFKLANC